MAPHAQTGEPAIRAEGLTKIFRYTEQSPGLTGALKGPFRPDRRERLDG